MDTNRVLTVIGILVLLGVFGFIVYSNNQATTPTESTTSTTVTQSPVASPAAITKQITIMLDEQNNSSESGTATLVEENGMVKVTLAMVGAPKGVSQPAHIHTGKCPQVGAVTYPLTNVLDGKSETTLDTTFEKLMSELPMGINVHKSTTQASVYTACGDLVF